MRITRALTALALGAAVAASTATAAAAEPTASAAASAGASALREYEGTIVSVNRSDRTFRLRDSERGTIRIHVTGRTRYERLAGFKSLRRGQSAIEATVRRSRGAWVATEVERSGGGGRHGGDDHDDD